MSNWLTDRFDKFIQLKRGHDLPNQFRKKGSVEVISSSGVTDYHDTFISNTPGVITGRYGTIGEVFYTENPYWPLNTTLYVVDFKNNIPKFVYYFLKSFDFEKFNDKSAVPGINRNHIHEELITFPNDTNEQQSIASLLSSLDDKIDLLHRQNKTLEQMAETLFRHMFIERAEETWEETTLENICESIRSGGTPSTSNKEYYSGDINWYSTKELNDNFLFESLSKISSVGLANSSAKLFPMGTVLIAIYAAPTVGRLGILANEAACNQAACGLIPRKNICSKEFIYLFLKSQRSELNQLATGSAQQNLNVGKIKNYPIIIPPRNLMEEFDKVCVPLFDKICHNSSSIRQLEKTRDLLLPKLMNGSVRVINN